MPPQLYCVFLIAITFTGWNSGGRLAREEPFWYWPLATTWFFYLATTLVCLALKK